MRIIGVMIQNRTVVSDQSVKIMSKKLIVDNYQLENTHQKQTKELILK